MNELLLFTILQSILLLDKHLLIFTFIFINNIKFHDPFLCLLFGFHLHTFIFFCGTCSAPTHLNVFAPSVPLDEDDEDDLSPSFRSLIKCHFLRKLFSACPHLVTPPPPPPHVLLSFQKVLSLSSETFDTFSTYN